MLLSPLAEEFYQRPVVDVARDLLGARLVRRLNGQRISGWIIETEAYMGEGDLACHARAGRTLRTEVMYGPPGRAYVYFIYGIHWMFNVVTGQPGDPNAVLVRALLPSEGVGQIAASRPPQIHPRDWTNGPARLCQALQIDSRQNGANLTDPSSELLIEAGQPVADEHVITGPRVGINNVPEPWRSNPWRWRVNPQFWESISQQAFNRQEEKR